MKKVISKYFKDACALYYGLKAYGNEHVYFIQHNGNRHAFLIKDKKDKVAIQTILDKHNLLNISEKQDEIDLSAYQPEHEQFQEFYDDLVLKEQKHEQIGLVLLVGVYCMLIIFISYCLNTN